MKIAIIGTRGIPNRYGGYEQFAQHLSTELCKMGHQVAVYTPSYRKDVDNSWNKVEIRKVFFIRFLGSFFHFIYDFLSISDALKRNDDVLLICGYVTSFPGLWWYKKYEQKFFIHTDGFEWKRKKWNWLTRQFIKYCEKKIAKRFSNLISDHDDIHEYFLKQYQKSTFCIAYGCSKEIEIKHPQKDYFLVIARNEKENQIDLVIRAFIKSASEKELWIFTNKHIKNIKHPKIKIFLNNYNEAFLNNIRMHASAYIHAFTVGGTNPSLIEAMGYCKLIVAYDNSFHRKILDKHALYFSTEAELTSIFQQLSSKNISFTDYYKSMIDTKYNWQQITIQYISVFQQILLK